MERNDSKDYADYGIQSVNGILTINDCDGSEEVQHIRQEIVSVTENVKSVKLEKKREKSFE